MVSVSFGAGMEVDIASNDDLASQTERVLNRLPQVQQSTWPTIPRSNQAGSSGIVLLDFGGPPSGKMWFPTFLTLFGSNESEVVTGSQAAVYIGGDNGTVGNNAPALSNLFIPSPFMTIPSFTQIAGRDDLGIHYGDSFMVRISLLPNGQNVGGNLRVREVNAHAAETSFLR